MTAGYWLANSKHLCIEAKEGNEGKAAIFELLQFVLLQLFLAPLAKAQGVLIRQSIRLTR